ncbi:hypothetical protein GCM10023238_23230 [Streptomyces heliomycini]
MSSSTSVDTAARVRPMREATAARDSGPSALTVCITRERLRRRMPCWVSGNARPGPAGRALCSGALIPPSFLVLPRSSVR